MKKPPLMYMWALAIILVTIAQAAHGAPRHHKADHAPTAVSADNPLGLNSSSAYVVDQDSGVVILDRHADAVVPIASITKLMTALIISTSSLDMNEPITVTDGDLDIYKGTHSRLAVGTTLTRQEMLRLALMASENRAASALGRTYPGGEAVFVATMNAKAQELGMTDTHYVEPTGLSAENHSSAKDLSILVKAAYEQQVIRDYSTTPAYSVTVGSHTLAFHSTNALVRGGGWDIGLQKTGFINEAGLCMLMSVQIGNRHIIMVLLHGTQKNSRVADAQKIRHWLQSAKV